MGHCPWKILDFAVAVCREEHLHYLCSCRGAAASHQHPVFEVEGGAIPVSFARSPVVHRGHFLIWAAFATGKIVPGWMQGQLPLMWFGHWSMLIYLRIYFFILIIFLFQRMAEHRGKCYIPDSCPCTWKDREFLSGEVIATPCYTWWVACILHISKSSQSSQAMKLA